MARRKTWAEKMEAGGRSPRVKRIEKPFAGRKAGEKMLIATPRLVESYIRAIPEGQSVDVKTLRDDLAREAGADFTCPVSTGMFLRIVAEAAWEAHEKGTPIDALPPIWRVLDSQSPTLKKLSFDPEFLLAQRRKEGLPV